MAGASKSVKVTANLDASQTHSNSADLRRRQRPRLPLLVGLIALRRAPFQHAIGRSAVDHGGSRARRRKDVALREAAGAAGGHEDARAEQLGVQFGVATGRDLSALPLNRPGFAGGSNS